MMTVRFSSGFSIQYNYATYVTRSQEFTDLYTAKGGRWIAQVPNESCVIEVVRPCAVYNPISQANEDVRAEVARLAKEIRSLKRALAKKGAKV